jgi:hypothetical protein
VRGGGQVEAVGEREELVSPAARDRDLLQRPGREEEHPDPGGVRGAFVEVGDEAVDLLQRRRLIDERGP